MIKKYKTKIIGSGNSTEDARRPEFSDNVEIKWNYCGEDGNYMLIEIDDTEKNYKDLKNYSDTVEI